MFTERPVYPSSGYPAQLFTDWLIYVQKQFPSQLSGTTSTHCKCTVSKSVNLLYTVIKSTVLYSVHSKDLTSVQGKVTEES